MKTSKCIVFALTIIFLLTLFSGSVFASASEISSDIDKGGLSDIESSVEEIPVEKIPFVEPSPNVEDMQGLTEVPAADNQQVIISELTQIRVCLQILVFAVLPLIVSVIALTKLITWFSRRFT